MIPQARPARALRALSLAIGALAALPGSAAQPQAPASAPQHELSVSLRDALSFAEDYSLTFAQEPVFALLRYVKQETADPPEGAPLISDWRALLERPADFRGAAVTVEGPVERCSGWQFQREDLKALGPVWELQLRVSGQPLTIKVLCTDDVGEIPLGARVRVAGWFAMIHDYYGPSNRRQHAALLITPRPVAITPPAARTAAKDSSLVPTVVIIGLALLIGWWLVRRLAPASRPFDPAAVGPSERAPLNLSEDLARWAEKEPVYPDDVDPAEAKDREP